MQGAARSPGRRAGALGLLVWKQLRSRRVGPSRHSSRWQYKCHWLPVQRDGSLAAKETGEDELGPARAPLLGRSLDRKKACPELLGPRRQQILGHLSLGQTCASHQAPTLYSQKQLPEITGRESDADFLQDVEAWRRHGV